MVIRKSQDDLHDFLKDSKRAKKLCAIIEEQIGDDWLLDSPEHFHDNFRDHFDSLDMIEMEMRIESVFRVEFDYSDEHDDDELVTVGDYIKWVDRKIAEAKDAR
jgi:acyl carrier protein